VRQPRDGASEAGSMPELLVSNPVSCVEHGRWELSLGHATFFLPQIVRTGKRRGHALTRCEPLRGQPGLL
jgi:hypothetical protein